MTRLQQPACELDKSAIDDDDVNDDDDASSTAETETEREREGLAIE